MITMITISITIIMIIMIMIIIVIFKLFGSGPQVYKSASFAAYDQVALSLLCIVRG